MEFVKEEVALVNYVLKVDGYKSSKKIKLKDDIFLMIPNIKFYDFAISELNFEDGTFHIACQRSDINKVKLGIDQLNGTGRYIDVLRPNSDISTDHVKDIFVDLTIEESDSYYIYKGKLYSKEKYKLVKNINKIPNIFGTSGFSEKSITYNGNAIAPVSSKALVIKKLKMIEEIFRMGREVLGIKS